MTVMRIRCLTYLILTVLKVFFKYHLEMFFIVVVTL